MTKLLATRTKGRITILSKVSLAVTPQTHGRSVRRGYQRFTEYIIIIQLKETRKIVNTVCSRRNLTDQCIDVLKTFNTTALHVRMLYFELKHYRVTRTLYVRVTR